MIIHTKSGKLRIRRDWNTVTIAGYPHRLTQGTLLAGEAFTVHGSNEDELKDFIFTHRHQIRKVEVLHAAMLPTAFVFPPRVRITMPKRRRKNLKLWKRSSRKKGRSTS